MSRKPDSSSVRRSCRQRKPLYDSLNQSRLFTQIHDIIFTRSRQEREDNSRGPQRTFRHPREALNNNQESDDEEILDIYSRVKRRKRIISATNDQIYDAEESMQDESNQSMPVISPPKENKARVVSSSEEDSGEEQIQRRYFLREQKVAPERFKFEIEPHKKRVEVVVKRSSDYEQRAFRSPAQKIIKHRDYMKRRFKRKLEHAGSSTSSDSDISDDEKRFQQRKNKSLDRSRSELLPANMSPRSKKLAAVNRQKGLMSAITADLDPMNIDTTIGFQHVGGLTHHLQALKEMVLFPLIYPEIFEKFKISPPRGVLFYGAPGTGKTLVARALANECSKEGRKVAFFMRKGADCLSKWVGESERQLRLLFDQAYSMRPSIIFFDEIDGLAPVRSSRQDQIHSSIVSTLLALLDGLDQRGEVVVLGATNRLDALDPALRRPGRFDRELLFALPDKAARAQILKIHTAEWSPPLGEAAIEYLSEQFVGYCGADIKGVCTEAALVALRKKYPQIYASDKKLLLEPSSMVVTVADFETAMSLSVPSSKRSMSCVSKQLPAHMKPLLDVQLKTLIAKVQPEFKLHRTSNAGGPNSNNNDESNFNSVLDIFKKKRSIFGQKILLCANGPDHGQTNYLSPAIFHLLDHLPIFSLALSQIFSANHRAPEEAVSEILGTAAKFRPCVLFLPCVDVMMRVLPHSAWYTLASILQSWNGDTSVLIVSTADELYKSLDDEIKTIFDESTVVQITLAPADARRRFFSSILHNEMLKEPEVALEVLYEPLSEAPPAPPKPLGANEMRKFVKLERQMLRELRIFLREILARLLRDRRFAIFAKPVDPQEAPDYETIVETPMDLSTMMSKIDQHKYRNVEEFLDDVDLITRNALEYNPDRDQTDKLIRHRACALRDMANALIEQEYDSDFEAKCREIDEFKKTKSVSEQLDLPPAYVYVQPNHVGANQSLGSKNEGLDDSHLSGVGGSGSRPNLGRAASIVVRKYKARRHLCLSTSEVPLDEVKQVAEDEADTRSKVPSPGFSSDVFSRHGETSALASPTRAHQRQESKTIIYDEHKANKLLDLAVRLTSDFSVAKLEKLYAVMMRTCDKYDASADKTALIDELDGLLRSFC